MKWIDLAPDREKLGGGAVVITIMEKVSVF